MKKILAEKLSNDIDYVLSKEIKENAGSHGKKIQKEVTRGSVKDVCDRYKNKMSGWEIITDSFMITDGNDIFYSSI